MGVFKEPDKVREYCLREGFIDRVNPEDGVTYPYICEINEEIASEYRKRIEEDHGPCEYFNLFARMSPGGVKAPHQAHTDDCMGTTIALLSLTLPEDVPEGAGTSLLTHKEGQFSDGPVGFLAHYLWIRDMNRYDAWQVDALAPMKYNEIAYYEGTRFHRAEPVDGFGDTPENSRIMLIQFFTPESHK